MKAYYWVIAVVAVLGFGVLGYSMGAGGMGDAATEPVVVEGLEDPQQLVDMAQGVTQGDPNAPITIVEFADYQCPGCANFAQVVKPQINAAFVETGQAKFVFYDFPITSIHGNAFLAARAGRCAEDQGQFWAYHDMLFGNQPSWAAEANPIGSFVDYAEQIGLDEGDFEACLRSDRHAALVTANMRLGQELGVNGTPTVMVSAGGMYSRAPQNNYQAIEGLVRELQEQAGVGPAADAGEDGAGDGTGDSGGDS